VSGLTRETAPGFTIVWAGFGAALVALYTSAVGGERRPRSLLGTLAAAGTAAALFLPAIRGTDRTGDEIVLTAWSGLDVISVATIIVLLIATAARPWWPCPASAAVLLGGNLLIQETTQRGTDVEWGLPVALGCAIVTTGVLLLGARRVSEAS
jgi:hypothetical protein